MQLDHPIESREGARGQVGRPCIVPEHGDVAGVSPTRCTFGARVFLQVALVRAWVHFVSIRCTQLGSDEEAGSPPHRPRAPAVPRDGNLLREILQVWKSSRCWG